MKKQLTAEQIEKRDARRAAFQETCRKIKALSEVQRAELAASCPVVNIEGHVLSLKNRCLIALQSPAATVVGGFRQWLKVGRCVRKGEHGISIWVPAGGRKAKKEDGDTEYAEGAETFFIAGTVFDVSQTEETGAAVVDVAPAVELPGFSLAPAAVEVEGVIS